MAPCRVRSSCSNVCICTPRSQVALEFRVCASRLNFRIRTSHLHFVFPRRTSHSAFARCTCTSHSHVALAFRVRTSHLHFAFARCACTSRSHVALAFRVRTSHLHGALIRRVRTLHLHFAFARRIMALFSQVSALSSGLGIFLGRVSWILVEVFCRRRRRVSQVMLACHMPCAALCTLHISCVALVFCIRTLHSRFAFARRICFAIS